VEPEHDQREREGGARAGSLRASYKKGGEPKWPPLYDF
jgi:hypothetical protein